MPTFLPEDSNDNPIPALRLASGGAHTVNVTANCNRNINPFNADTRVVSLYASASVYIAFGDDSVVATTGDHYFPAGVYYDIAIGGEKTGHYTHVAVLRVDADGALYVSEKE